MLYLGKANVPTPPWLLTFLQSRVEMLEVRRKVTEDRLRLGKFQMVRQGGSFVEVWSDGYAFDDLKRQANIIFLCARPTCTYSSSVSMIQMSYCHYSQNLV